MGVRETSMMSMRAQAAMQTAGGPAFEIKGTIAPVTVLCLRSIDADQIERELRARVEPAPQLFLNAPIVIDVADVDGAAALPLAAIVDRVRACRLVPIGVAHLPAEQLTLAAEIGLAVMQLGFGRSRGARASSPEPTAPASPARPTTAAASSVASAVAAAKAASGAAAASSPPRAAPATGPATLPPLTEPKSTLTITQPVRGGQVSYAGGSDLVVVAAVNPGAQVIADGHVHVYGRLRGRALAGARGLAEARVFCQSLEAELVAIAGEFLTADDIPSKMRGKPAQIFMEHGSVRVAPL
jgi:septum site-determining protein MinC